MKGNHCDFESQQVQKEPLPWRKGTQGREKTFTIVTTVLCFFQALLVLLPWVVKEEAFSPLWLFGLQGIITEGGVYEYRERLYLLALLFCVAALVLSLVAGVGCLLRKNKRVELCRASAIVTFVLSLFFIIPYLGLISEWSDLNGIFTGIILEKVELTTAPILAMLASVALFLLAAGLIPSGAPQADRALSKSIHRNYGTALLLASAAFLQFLVARVCIDLSGSTRPALLFRAYFLAVVPALCIAVNFCLRLVGTRPTAKTGKSAWKNSIILAVVILFAGILFANAVFYESNIERQVDWPIFLVWCFIRGGLLSLPLSIGFYLGVECYLCHPGQIRDLIFMVWLSEMGGAILTSWLFSVNYYAGMFSMWIPCIFQIVFFLVVKRRNHFHFCLLKGIGAKSFLIGILQSVGIYAGIFLLWKEQMWNPYVCLLVILLLCLRVHRPWVREESFSKEI